MRRVIDVMSFTHHNIRLGTIAVFGGDGLTTFWSSLFLLLIKSKWKS